MVAKQLEERAHLMDAVSDVLSLAVAQLSCDELNFPVSVPYAECYCYFSTADIAAVAADGCSDVSTSLNANVNRKRRECDAVVELIASGAVKVFVCEFFR